MGPIREPFVGRRRELSQLARAIERVCAGHGTPVLLEGEAGIGKTALTREVARQARARGMVDLWGRCLEGEQCAPYGPWTEVLRAHIRQTDGQALARHAGDAAVELAQLLPELKTKVASLPPGPPLSVDDGEQRLLASMVLFLKSLARDRPLSIALDNLHLADAASLKLLRHLAPELESSPMLIVGTVREPAEARADGLDATIEELTKATGFVRLRLEGLSTRDVRELLSLSLAERSTPTLAGEIRERTDGNPLFVRELLRDLSLNPDPPEAAPRLPRGISELICRRLARLSPLCRNLLASGAVLGRDFRTDVLQRVVGGSVTEEEVLAELREAAAAALVVESQAQAPGHRFTHAVVQETLLHETPVSRRTQLHARTAEVLKAMEATDPERRSTQILHHLLASGRRAAPLEVVECASRAVDEATAQYAPDDALRLIDVTLTEWERLGRARDARVAPLLHMRGRVLTDLQRPTEARQSLIEAFDLYTSEGNRRAAVDVALTPTMERVPAGSWLSSAAGGGSGVRELRERALSFCPPRSPEHETLLVQRGSRKDLQHAIDYARGVGDGALEASALARLAYHELLAWDFGASRRILAAAETLALRGGDLANMTTCAYTRFYLGFLTGNSSEAEAASRDLHELAGRVKSRRSMAAALRCAAMLAAARGDWSEARRCATECISGLPTSLPVFNLMVCYSVLVQVELETGHLKAATEWLLRAARTDAPGRPTDVRQTARGSRVTGDRSLLPLSPETVEIQDPQGPLIVFVSTQALAAAELASIHHDHRVAAQYREHLVRWKGTCNGQRSTDALLGLLCAVLGRIDESVQHFEDALALCRRASYRPELAWSATDFAETLLQRGSAADAGRADALLREALTICQELGMAPLRRRILGLLGPLERRSFRRRSELDGVTNRELEVLELVARGFTNLEIADRLYISPLTAARHVHNLLDKTGMANRSELTAWAGRQGLLDHRPAAHPSSVHDSG